MNIQYYIIICPQILMPSVLCPPLRFIVAKMALLTYNLTRQLLQNCL